MMQDEKYNLKWNDFEKNFCQSVRNIRLETDFHDVTLSVGTKQLKAHKLILSSCSSFFKTILKENPHQHPLLYLRNISYEDLQAVLDFMYFGEVNVEQANLSSFLAITEELQIHGLSAQPGQEKKNTYIKKPHEKPSTDMPPTKRTKLAALEPDPGPKPRPNLVQSLPKREINSMPEIQVINLKQEPDDIPLPPPLEELPLTLEPQQHHQQHHPQHIQPLSENELQLVDGEEDYYDYQDVDLNDDQPLTDPGEILLTRPGISGNPASFECQLCGQMFNDRSNARRHAKAQHLDTPTSCPECYKTCKNRRGLKAHIKTYHNTDTPS